MNRPLIVVLVCLAAGVIEVGMFVIAVHTSYPNWDLALAASRAGIPTSLTCIVAGIIGARRNPALGFSELGIVVGIAGLLVGLFIEALSHSCFVCI